MKELLGGEGVSANWRPRVGCGTGSLSAAGTVESERTFSVSERRRRMVKRRAGIMMESVLI
jgi:hypothetical protein